MIWNGLRPSLAARSLTMIGGLMTTILSLSCWAAKAWSSTNAAAAAAGVIATGAGAAGTDAGFAADEAPSAEAFSAARRLSSIRCSEAVRMERWRGAAGGGAEATGAGLAADSAAEEAGVASTGVSVVSGF